MLGILPGSLIAVGLGIGALGRETCATTSSTRCSRTTNDDELPARTDMYYLTPTRFSWATGDHSLMCLIELPKDYSGRQLPV